MNVDEISAAGTTPGSMAELSGTRASASPIGRVVFICGIEGAPLRYRAQFPAEALALLGISSQVFYYTDPQIEPALADADVVVIYRTYATHRMLRLVEMLRKRKIPVLFDVDDLIFDPDISDDVPALKILPPEVSEGWLRGVRMYRTLMQQCDAFIGSTDALVEYAERVVGMRARRFPNGVSVHMARIADGALQRPRSSGPPRIGYLSGTITHDLDWFHIEPAIVRVLDRFPEAELWLVGHVPKSDELERFGERIRRLPMQLWQRLPAILRDVDINLAPLAPGSLFNEAKSAIKWLEAALVATPTVASPTQPFREAIEQGSNGLLADTPDEWERALSTLLDDHSARRRMGERARRDALFRWSPWLQARRYREILEWGMELVATDAERRARHPAPALVADEMTIPHPLEPYELILLGGRTAPQVPTARIRPGNPVEFLLSVGRTEWLRLDMQFHTHGGEGRPVEVALCDPATGSMLASAVAQEGEIQDDEWASFHFKLARPASDLLVRVGWPAGTDGRNSRISLWAERLGTHLSRGRAQVGGPCVRVWAQDELALNVSPSTARPGRLAVVAAKIRLGEYLRRTRGEKYMVRRVYNALKHRAGKFVKQLVGSRRSPSSGSGGSGSAPSSGIHGSQQDLPSEIVRIDIPDYIAPGKSFRMDLAGGSGAARGVDLIVSVVQKEGWRAFEAPLPDLFAAYALRSRGLVLDVGANTGFYSLIACAVSDSVQVHAFEPFAPVADSFEANVKLNDTGERIRLFREAVSDHDGQAEFYIPVKNHVLVETSCSLNREFKEEMAESVIVPLVTLDSHLKQHGTEMVELLKIDVESFEHYVLKGGGQLIAEHRPVIFFELLHLGHPDAIEGVREANIYIAARLHADRIIIDNRVRYDEATMNHMLIPAEKIDALHSIAGSLGIPVEKRG